MGWNVEPLNWGKVCLGVDHTDKTLNGPLAVPWDKVNWPVIAALAGVCYLVSLEVITRVSIGLRELKDLYYWSMIVGSFGCIVHITGSLVGWLVPNLPWVLSTTVSVVGWWCMIVGQSLVLYSRIHLVVRDRKVIWALRIMIATTFVAFLIPAPLTSFLLGIYPTSVAYANAFNGLEKTQLCCFLVSESVLSLVYIVATQRVLQTNAVLRVKRVVRFLIIANAIIIFLDVIVLIMQFLNWYAIQSTLKPTVYAIKLKIEFAFLNQLFFITTQTKFDFVRSPKKASEGGSNLTGGDFTLKDATGLSSSKSRKSRHVDGPAAGHNNDAGSDDKKGSWEDDIDRDLYEIDQIDETEDAQAWNADSAHHGIYGGRADGVTTHISAAPMPVKDVKRQSVENLGTQDTDEIRRAELGLSTARF